LYLDSLQSADTEELYDWLEKVDLNVGMLEIDINYSFAFD